MLQHRRTMSGLITHHATTQRRATMSRIPRMGGTIGRRAATMRESGDLKPRRAATNPTPAMRLRVQPAPTAMTGRFRDGDDRNVICTVAPYPPPLQVQGRPENMCDAHFQQHQNAMAGKFGTRPCQCSA
jgi:hypothetical protein